MFKVIFMGTPNFAVPALKLIHKNYDVSAVYTQPDKPAKRGLIQTMPPLKKTALELGLPVFQPEKISNEDIKKIKKLAPDFLIVAAYGQILNDEVLSIPKINTLNIHSSLLPRWRGAAPIQWAILSGDKKSGVSIMKIIKKLDAGEVYLTKETEILCEDTGQTLHDRLSILGSEALLEVLRSYELGEVRGIAQDEALVTYAKKLTKEMEILNPYESSAVELDRIIRAFTPWPGTSLFFENHGRIKIKKACLLDIPCDFESGQLVENHGLLVLTTHQGALRVNTLQEDGKKEMSAQDFFNGLKGKGKKLPLRVKKSEKDKIL